jgi:mRNA interferase RelE/StbE
MASYTITWRKSTKKDLRRIPEADVREIVLAVEDLAGNPFPIGFTKMIGTKNVYRIRVGNYRVIYEIYGVELVVEVIRVGHRKDVYRQPDLVNTLENNARLAFPGMVLPWEVLAEAPGRGGEVLGAIR